MFLAVLLPMVCSQIGVDQYQPVWRIHNQSHRYSKHQTALVERSGDSLESREERRCWPLPELLSSFQDDKISIHHRSSTSTSSSVAFNPAWLLNISGSLTVELHPRPALAVPKDNRAGQPNTLSDALDIMLSCLSAVVIGYPTDKLFPWSSILLDLSRRQRLDIDAR